VGVPDPVKAKFLKEMLRETKRLSVLQTADEIAPVRQSKKKAVPIPILECQVYCDVEWSGKGEPQ
jgi:hypothetical protein